MKRLKNTCQDFARFKRFEYVKQISSTEDWYLFKKNDYINIFIHVGKKKIAATTDCNT